MMSGVAVDNVSPGDINSSVLRTTSISKSFTSNDNETHIALQDINLSIKRDQFVTLVGPSGCGKSTLLKVMSGVIQPSAGKVFLDGIAMTSPSRDIGMVFQRPVLLPWRSVIDNVLFPIDMLNLNLAKYYDTAEELLSLVGLQGFESALPHELSGGMQQRVSICRALIYDPTVLMMDEPFGALDAMTREDLSLELLRIWSQRRKTVVFVTHSIVESVLLADRVIVMGTHPGRIVMDINVDLPRPRTMESTNTDAFQELVSIVRKTIYDQRQPCMRGSREG